MNANRLWVIAAGAAMILIAVGGWFVGISPIVAQGAAADSQTASINQANSANQAKLAVLKKQFTHIKKLQAKLDKLRLSIPEQAEASSFLSELNTLGSKYSVTLTSLTIASSTVYSAPASAASTSASTSTSTSTSTATPAPATSTPTATAPVASGGPLTAIPVQITVTGPYKDVLGFIGAVQTGQRLYLASGVSTNVGGSAYQGTMTGYLFTLQGTSDQPATPSDSSTATPTPYPTDTATATPTATPTSSPSSTVAPTKPKPKPTTVPTPGVTPTQAP